NSKRDSVCKGMSEAPQHQRCGYCWLSAPRRYRTLSPSAKLSYRADDWHLLLASTRCSGCLLPTDRKPAWFERNKRLRATVRDGARRRIHCAGGRRCWPSRAEFPVALQQSGPECAELYSALESASC